jgi:hypothetical protein
MRIALATCTPLPEPDPDEAIVLEAFRRAGCQVDSLPWNDPNSDWSACDVALLRSTWDYPRHAEAFRAWLLKTAAQTVLWNPLEVALWNLDKRYLKDLEAKSVPIVPTIFTADLSKVPWRRFVIKPTVSCGSFLTKAFMAEDRGAAESFLSELGRTHEPMIQPYMASIDAEGERSVVWIAGDFTHTLRKSPRFSGDSEAVSSAYAPSLEEIEVAARAIWAAPVPLLYARVDLMRSDNGRLLVSELELLEPSLFFLQHPPALDRYVHAVREAPRR